MKNKIIKSYLRVNFNSYYLQVEMLVEKKKVK